MRIIKKNVKIVKINDFRSFVLWKRDRIMRKIQNNSEKKCSKVENCKNRWNRAILGKNDRMIQGWRGKHNSKKILLKLLLFAS